MATKINKDNFDCSICTDACFKSKVDDNKFKIISVGDSIVCPKVCFHFFHKACIESWANKKNSTCPNCRSINFKANLIYFDTAVQEKYIELLNGDIAEEINALQEFELKESLQNGYITQDEYQTFLRENAITEGKFIAIESFKTAFGIEAPTPIKNDGIPKKPPTPPKRNPLPRRRPNHRQTPLSQRRGGNSPPPPPGNFVGILIIAMWVTIIAIIIIARSKPKPAPSPSPLISPPPPDFMPKPPPLPNFYK